MIGVLLIGGILVAVSLLLGTERGRQLLDRENLRQLGADARLWVSLHPAPAVLAVIGAYTVCTILLLPVWWIQFLAGLTFGLASGLLWVVVGSTFAAVATAGVSRWFGEDWVARRVFNGNSAGKWISRFHSMAGRNGFLIVLICRLSYPVPYGISNYLFGLMGIRLGTIALGTAIGGLPVHAGWVAAGARPEWLADWRFWTLAIGVNLLILAVLLWRKKYVISSPAPLSCSDVGRE